MDLDSFLEKDIVSYLENAVKFGVQDRSIGADDADMLLADKQNAQNIQQARGSEQTSSAQTSQTAATAAPGSVSVPTNVTLNGNVEATLSKDTKDTLEEDVAATVAEQAPSKIQGTVEIDAAQVAVQGPSTTTTAAPLIKEEIKEPEDQEEVEEQEPVAPSQAPKTPADSPSPSQTTSQPVIQPIIQPIIEVPVPAPATPPVQDKEETASTPSWFDKLEEKATEAQAELETIIDLEDSLNDLLEAIDAKDLDKAKALHDHLILEAEGIIFHPGEKIFLLTELKRYADKLEEIAQAPTPAQVSAPASSPTPSPSTASAPAKDSTQSSTSLVDEEALDEQTSALDEFTDEDIDDRVGKLAKKTEHASSVELDELTGELVEQPKTADSPSSSQQAKEHHSSLPLPDVLPEDLPPSFVQDETKVVYSYVAGVQALRNKDKSKALEIFLNLTKQRPTNLAIKIRLQEAIELP